MSFASAGVAGRYDALLYLTALLLQFDEGDGPRWLMLTAMLGGGGGQVGSEPPAFWPSEGPAFVLNFVLFAPLVFSWIRLRRPARSH